MGSNVTSFRPTQAEKYVCESVIEGVRGCEGCVCMCIYVTC